MTSGSIVPLQDFDFGLQRFLLAFERCFVDDLDGIQFLGLLIHGLIHLGKGSPGNKTFEGS